MLLPSLRFYVKTSADQGRWYAEGDGVHWQKYEKESDRLASMGITACWLPRESINFHLIIRLTTAQLLRRGQVRNSDYASDQNR